MRTLLEYIYIILFMIILLWTVIQQLNPFKSNDVPFSLKGIEKDLEDEIAHDLHLK